MNFNTASAMSNPDCNPAAATASIYSLSRLIQSTPSYLDNVRSYAAQSDSNEAKPHNQIAAAANYQPDYQEANEQSIQDFVQSFHSLSMIPNRLRSPSLPLGSPMERPAFIQQPLPHRPLPQPSFPNEWATQYIQNHSQSRIHSQLHSVVTPSVSAQRESLLLPRQSYPSAGIESDQSIAQMRLINSMPRPTASQFHYYHQPVQLPRYLPIQPSANLSCSSPLRSLIPSAAPSASPSPFVPHPCVPAAALNPQKEQLNHLTRVGTVVHQDEFKVSGDSSVAVLNPLAESESESASDSASGLDWDYLRVYADEHELDEEEADSQFICRGHWQAVRGGNEMPVLTSDQRDSGRQGSKASHRVFSREDRELSATPSAEVSGAPVTMTGTVQDYDWHRACELSESRLAASAAKLGPVSYGPEWDSQANQIAAEAQAAAVRSANQNQDDLHAKNHNCQQNQNLQQLSETSYDEFYG